MEVLKIKVLWQKDVATPALSSVHTHTRTHARACAHTKVFLIHKYNNNVKIHQDALFSSEIQLH